MDSFFKAPDGTNMFGVKFIAGDTELDGAAFPVADYPGVQIGDPVVVTVEVGKS